MIFFNPLHLHLTVSVPFFQLSPDEETHIYHPVGGENILSKSKKKFSTYISTPISIHA